MKRMFAFLVVLVLAACAPTTRGPEVDGRDVRVEDAKQHELVAEMKKQRMQRLVDVSDPLLRNNTEICGAKVAPYFGVDFIRSGDIVDEQRAALAKAYHIGPKLTAVLVAAHGPAYRAGMREGDELVSVNGKAVPDEKRAMQRLYEMLKDEAEKSPVVTFKVLRAGRPWSFVVRSVMACNMAMVLENDTIINAFANGKSVTVSSGMLNLATDEELGVVIGHEMAHNAMMHIESKTETANAGLILDIALEWLSGVPSNYAFTKLGSEAYSHAQEFEADYVGMYIAARGGCAVDKATEFWRRMSADLGRVNGDSNSHPNTPERYLKIQAIADEIWLKKSRGEPLMPTMKDGGPFRAPSLETAPEKGSKKGTVASAASVFGDDDSK